MGTKPTPSEDEPELEKTRKPRIVMVAKATVDERKTLMIDPDSIRLVTEHGDDDPRG